MQQLDKRYYTLTVEQALVVLNTDPEKGLENQQASLRLLQYGQNVVEDKREKSMQFVASERSRRKCSALQV
ncbi:cation-transporting P-type ATPase [Dyadobacter endophyticus]|uniref:cation-transporting P-type ATPase n=1 Tax=Dyadobacter endophyticus TaxID=1749036 RepID=UPI003CEFFD65